MSRPDEERNFLPWKQLVQTADGRAKLIATFQNPIRAGLRHHSLTTQLLARGTKVPNEMTFEEPVSTPWAGFRERRFHMLDRMQELLRVRLTTELDTRLLREARESGPPLAEDFPEGKYDKVVMNVYTFIDLRKRRLIDVEGSRDIVANRFGHFRKAQVLISRLAQAEENGEPGLLYGFGKPVDVGLYQLDVEVEDICEHDEDGKLETVAFVGRLIHRMKILDDPKLGVYVYDIG